MTDIRRLTQFDEMGEVVAAEKAIWGEATVLRSLLLVFAHHGGVVLGAYHEGSLAGFCVGFPGLDETGGLYLHSHMLGVMPEFRRHAIGTALKHAQWQHAKAMGYRYIGWTYDPLQRVNAWFNIEVLRARVRHFVADAYGTMNDQLNGSAPTHRFWVTWSPEWPEPRWQAGPDRPNPIPIPADITALRQTRPERAAALAAEYRREFERYFAEGYEVRAVIRQDGHYFYELDKKVAGNAD